jgi:hypothetical protein
MGGGTGADAPLGLDLRQPRDGVGSDPDGSPTATSRPVAGQASGR